MHYQDNNSVRFRDTVWWSFASNVAEESACNFVQLLTGDAGNRRVEAERAWVMRWGRPFQRASATGLRHFAATSRRTASPGSADVADAGRGRVADQSWWCCCSDVVEGLRESARRQQHAADSPRISRGLIAAAGWCVPAGAGPWTRSTEIAGRAVLYNSATQQLRALKRSLDLES